MVNPLQRQIDKMLAASQEPRRRARESSTDLPWTSPIFAVVFALGKLTRVVKVNGKAVSLQIVDPDRTTEELREAAHYLLRAAELIEREADYGSN